MSKYLDYVKNFGGNEESVFWVQHNLSNYLKSNPEDQTEIEHILDYLTSPDAPKRLKSMAYSEAKSNADKWSKAQQKKGSHIKETAKDTEVVLDFEDGFKIVKLVGENAYKREGYLMSHCVGGYYGNDSVIYSLRDKDNMPHATLEEDQQIKGKGNGSIHPKYVVYIVRFLEHIGMTVGDHEMKNLGYFNAEAIKDDLHPDTDLFNDKYIHESQKLINKDGGEYASLELLNLKPLISKDEKSLKINFELPSFIKLSFETMTSKIKVSKTGSATSGDDAHSATSGDYAHSATSGHRANSATSGYGAHSATSGVSDAIACAIGRKAKAKASKGCFIVLAEWHEGGRWEDAYPKEVKSVKVDGKKIKADQWYKLVNGEFIETDDSNE